MLTVAIEVFPEFVELEVEELAPGGLVVLEAALGVDLHEVGADKVMVVHVLDAGLVQLVVFEAHDSVAHEDALQVDHKALVVENPFGEVGDVLARIALPGNLGKRQSTKNLELRKLGNFVVNKSFKAA